MVSVVIPLFNNAATVGRAVGSVLKQTMTDFELIVVDNGSTDGGDLLVEAMTDSRVRLVREARRGVSHARNRGIAEARGEWVAFLDADDEWDGHFLATTVRLGKEYGGCALCATAYRRCNSLGHIQDIRLSHCPATDDFIMDNYFEVASESDPPFCSISVMIRKHALMAVGGFPEDVCQGEDLLTWARLAVDNCIAYSKKVSSTFHVGETSSMGVPRRVPPNDDVVGRELEVLYNTHTGLPGLEKYLSHWHKMRASVYLRLPGCGHRCRREVRECRRWHRNRKVTLYVLLSLIPYRARMALLSHHV